MLEASMVCSVQVPDALLQPHSAQIENVATQCLSIFNSALLEEPHPIPIEEVIDEGFGLRQLPPVYLSMDGSVVGMTIFSEGKVSYRDSRLQPQKMFVCDGDVLLDRSLYNSGQEARLRFTLAHLLAHWILHKNYFQGSSDANPPAPPFICRTENVESTRSVQQLVTDVDWLEWQADAFAAALLMPQDSFRKAWEKHRGQPDLRTELAKVFLTSEKAVGIRMQQLGLEAL